MRRPVRTARKFGCHEGFPERNGCQGKVDLEGDSLGIGRAPGTMKGISGQANRCRPKGLHGQTVRGTILEFANDLSTSRNTGPSENPALESVVDAGHGCLDYRRASSDACPR